MSSTFQTVKCIVLVWQLAGSLTKLKAKCLIQRCSNLNNTQDSMSAQAKGMQLMWCLAYTELRCVKKHANPYTLVVLFFFYPFKIFYLKKRK